MRVLVACEFSGVVREAFRKRGHDAISCDLSSSLDDSPFHIQQDVLRIMRVPHWDLVVSHPPCTRLTVAGARWFKGREDEQREAAEFFMKFTELQCRWAIENPIGVMSRLYRKPDQIAQPWMFGEGETKATCLWLNRLPLLRPTDIVAGRIPRVHYESPGVKNGLTRQQRRSISYQGIADAMAEQWGSLEADHAR